MNLSLYIYLSKNINITNIEQGNKSFYIVNRKLYVINVPEFQVGSYYFYYYVHIMIRNNITEREGSGTVALILI